MLGYLSDDMYPAIACDDDTELVFDCERFDQVIVIAWNEDFSYFGRQDQGDDQCILQQGSCKIPITHNAAHEAELLECEGEAFCVVTYAEHADMTCDTYVTNYEQVIYQCEDRGIVRITCCFLILQLINNLPVGISLQYVRIVDLIRQKCIIYVDMPTFPLLLMKYISNRTSKFKITNKHINIFHSISRKLCSIPYESCISNYHMLWNITTVFVIFPTS